MNKKIGIVVPVLNEQANVSILIDAIALVMESNTYDYSITFVDDGSSDATVEKIKEIAQKNNKVFYISFSRNFGHQNALKAGLDCCEADAVISLDGDMQHPPNIIPAMITQWENGYDIVYSIRQDAKENSLVKRKTSNFFYDFINRLSDIDLENGTADFRLMDQRVVAICRGFSEMDLFWRGLVKWVGFKQIGIEYQPAERMHGQSKYTLKKMTQFALKGITSFSTKPLNIATYLGFIFSALSLLYIPYVVYSMLAGRAISGWASTIVTIAFFGGMQLMILGIIGMYLGKMFMQSKQRPHYIIKESNLK